MCRHLETVNIPSGCSHIGISSFEGCTALHTISIPSSVTRIGARAFERCSALVTVNFLSTNDNDNNHNGPIVVDKGAFSLCTSLQILPVPPAVQSLGPAVYSSCSSATSVSLPSSIVHIGDNAFANCRCLTSIEVPGTCCTESIKGNIEKSTSESTDMDQSCVQVLERGLGRNVFEGCVGLVTAKLPIECKHQVYEGELGLLEFVSVEFVAAPSDVPADSSAEDGGVSVAVGEVGIELTTSEHDKE